MSDTKLLEYVALHLIAHRLAKEDLFVALPSFDAEGTDLLVFADVKENAKFCKVQSKYRSLIRSESAHIEIPESYVTAHLIVFLFIDNGDESSRYLYCFFQEDISHWEKNEKDKYVLNFTKNTFQEKLASSLLDKDRIERIRAILEKVDSRKEILHFIKAQTNVRFESLVPNEIYRDDQKIVRVEKTPTGLVSRIIDRATGIERHGSSLPTDNLENVQYNPATDTFSVKNH
jgi:hypothetical protein